MNVSGEGQVRVAWQIPTTHSRLNKTAAALVTSERTAKIGGHRHVHRSFPEFSVQPAAARRKFAPAPALLMTKAEVAATTRKSTRSVSATTPRRSFRPRFAAGRPFAGCGAHRDVGRLGLPGPRGLRGPLGGRGQGRKAGWEMNPPRYAVLGTADDAIRAAAEHIYRGLAMLDGPERLGQ